MVCSIMIYLPKLIISLRNHFYGFWENFIGNPNLNLAEAVALQTSEYNMSKEMMDKIEIELKEAINAPIEDDEDDFEN